MSSVRGQGQETGRRRRIAEVIGAQLEPITRFKGSDLKELAPDHDSSAELIATTRQRVDLDIECASASHSGRLPTGIAMCPNVAAMDAELQLRLATAESGAAAQIQQWATEEPGRYRRLLPGGMLFSDPMNGAIGAEWPCTTCAQRGRLGCKGCTGSGAQTCPDCQGRRHGACRQCRGLGRLACNQDWLNCTACAGRGEQDCTRCATSGCIVCPDCTGQQEVDCLDCATTGWHHQWGRLRERLEIEDLLEVHHPDPAIAEAIAARFTDMPTLDMFCTLEQVRYTTAPLAVQAIHRLKLPVRQARLQVAGQPMHFTALGPALEIIDHQQIASVLLAHDLATLEKNAAGSGRHLGEALQRFLQSPLNREIAARTPPAEIARLHPGMVDETYQTRARQSAQRAVERLWLQRVWRPRLFCLVGVGVVAALAVVLGSPRLGLVSAATLAVGTGTVAWLIADWQARQGLAQSLQIPQGDRLLRPLRQSDTVRHWQLKSLAVAVLVALASAGGMARLPLVRQHAEQAQAASVLSEQLGAWLVSEGKDYRLRHYPAAAALAQAAEQTPTDPRARLIRAWQLLLGTDSVAPDPRAAERLLDGLDAHPQLGSATVIARARATLWLRSRSVTALQTAATALEMLADPQQPEALFTLALVQLTPTFAARAGGPQQGLVTLQQAADLGHASACFELGRRLASGTGLRRDLVGARRYLGYAEAKGVPGAAQAAAAIH